MRAIIDRSAEFSGGLLFKVLTLRFQLVLTQDEQEALRTFSIEELGPFGGEIGTENNWDVAALQSGVGHSSRRLRELQALERQLIEDCEVLDRYLREAAAYGGHEEIEIGGGVHLPDVGALFK